MIKINKLENVFGIVNLRGANDLKNISVIYAPNGTAKTSIADAIFQIGNCCDIDSIKDVYGNLSSPSYEIDINGTICNEIKRIPFSVIKYFGVSDFDLGSGINYANIVMSNNVKNLISKSIIQIDNAKKTIQSLIDGQFPTKKNTDEYKNALSMIANTSPANPDLFLKLVQSVDLNIQPLAITVTEKMFIELVNQKVKDTCSLPAVVNGANQYFNITNNKELNLGRPCYLDDNFTLDKLQDLHKNAIKNSFYKESNPERKLSLNGTLFNEEDVNTIISKEVTRVYGTSGAKEAFDEISRSFKGKKKAIDILNTNPALISKLSNYNKLILELFITIIDPVIPQIKNLINGITTAQEEIQRIRTTYDSSDNKITAIWNEFNSRFKFKKFDLKVDNEFNAAIGNEVPVFTKYISGTNQKVTDPKLLRFSTGEIKVFNLINFIISVESLRSTKTNFTIVLDDAVDSFDYKNKYGIIDYLCDIKDDPNVQLIILTHNFDFYRSTILNLGDNVGQYFAYRNNDNEIDFYDTSNDGYLLTIVKFNGWKSNPTAAKYFALIPFARNVLQLSSNAKDPSVKSIDDYLHYQSCLCTKTINDLDSILSRYMKINKPHAFSGSESYMVEMQKIIEQILNETLVVNETDLEYKILMGLYIRIFMERFLYKNYEDSTGNIPQINNINRKTRDLIQCNLPYLKPEEKSHIIEANVISPAYAHFNSFMYEPLIDVGTSELIESVRWIYNKNAFWPL